MQSNSNTHAHPTGTVKHDANPSLLNLNDISVNENLEIVAQHFISSNMFSSGASFSFFYSRVADLFPQTLDTIDGKDSFICLNTNNTL